MARLLFDNPGPLFLVVLCCAFLLFRWRTGWKSKHLIALLVACGVVGTGLYVVLIVLNISRVGMLWHDEANILSIAAGYSHGLPIYHSIASDSFYSLFYGPSTFLVYAPFLAVFPNPILALGIGLFVVSLGDVILLYGLMRRWVRPSAALALLPVGLAFLLAYPGVLFADRGDVWLLFCVTLALLIAVRSQARFWLVASLVCGVMSGLAIDFKVTALPVACVLAAVLYRRFGVRAVVSGVLACLFAAFAIFALPHVSLTNYVAWLVVSGHQRFLRSTCLGNLIAAFLLVAPMVLIFRTATPGERPRRLGWIIASTAFALVVCVISGSKDGAGGWHLWPLLPVFLGAAAYAASLRGEGRVDRSSAIGVGGDVVASKTLIALASLAVAGTVSTAYFAAKDYRVVRPRGDREFRVKEGVAQSELEGLSRRPFGGQSLTMGYGAAVTDYRTDLRYELVLANRGYFFDENSVVEGIKAGFPVPERVTERILGCQDVWVIPHDEAPFSSVRLGVLPTAASPYIFPDEIRLGFAKTHVRFEQGAVYDLWTCGSNLPTR